MVRKGLTRLGMIALFSWGLTYGSLLAQEKDLGVRPTRGEMQGVRVYRKLHALIVGVNKYPNLPPDKQLHFAEKDARDVYDTLTQSFGFERENVTLLLGDKATKRAIEDALAELTSTRRVDKEDMVVIFFSMHGATVKVGEREVGFLVPHDAQVNLNEPDDASEYYKYCISMETLWERLEICPAKHVLVLVDACYSGLLARTVEPTKPHPLTVLAELPARQVLTAGTREQVVLEDPRWGNGAFTKKLLEYLRAWASARPGEPLSVLDLAAYVQKGVIELTDKRQTPVLAARATQGSCLLIPVAKPLADASAPPPPSTNPPDLALPASKPTPVPKAQKFQFILGNIRSIAFSTDMQLIASGNPNGTIDLWRVSDGQLVRTLQGHTSTVWSVAFSSDGQWLAGGDENAVRLWRVSDGQLVRTLQGHTDAVFCVAFSSDGQWLASGGSDKTVRLWRVSDGQLVRTLEGPAFFVSCIAFSTDEQWLASGGADRTVRIWRVSDGQLVRTLEGHTDWVESVAFSSDGRWLASGGSDKTVRLWRVSDGQLVRILEGHTSAVTAIAFTGDGEHLVSLDVDGRLLSWRVAEIVAQP